MFYLGILPNGKPKMSVEQRKNTLPEGKHLTKAITRGKYEETIPNNKKSYFEQKIDAPFKKGSEKTTGLRDKRRQYLLGAEVTEEIVFLCLTNRICQIC